MLLGGVGECMGHVVRQDEEAFHQRGDQHDDHGERYVGDEVAEPAADGHEAEERDDRRDRRREDRQEHPPRGALGGGLWVFAEPARTEIRMFAHHDRVVDDDAERDDEREERDHVEGDAGGVHQRERRRHRHRNAGGDPEGGAAVQKQEQKRHDEAEAHQSVFEENVETLRNVLGPPPDEVDPGASGQPRLHLGGDLLDLALDLDSVTPRRPVNPDRHRRVVTDEIGAVAVWASDQYACHIADGEIAAAGFGAQHDPRDLVGRPLGDPGAHAGRARNVAGRARFRLPGDRRGDLAHGDVVLDEAERCDLDHGFGCGETPDRGARDALREEPGDELVREAAQLVHADGSGDDDVGNPVAPDAPAHLGVLRLFGQVRHRIDRRGHVFGGAPHVPARLELELDRRAALARHRRAALHPLDGEKRRFEKLDDAGVDILRPGTVPADADRDPVDHHVGEELGAHVRERHRAEHHEHDEKQVRRRAVAREVAQDAAGDGTGRAHHLAAHPRFDAADHIRGHLVALKARVSTRALGFRRHPVVLSTKGTSLARARGRGRTISGGAVPPPCRCAWSHADAGAEKRGWREANHLAPESPGARRARQALPAQQLDFGDLQTILPRRAPRTVPRNPPPRRAGRATRSSGGSSTITVTKSPGGARAASSRVVKSQRPVWPSATEALSRLTRPEARRSTPPTVDDRRDRRRDKFTRRQIKRAYCARRDPGTKTSSWPRSMMSPSRSPSETRGLRGTSETSARTPANGARKLGVGPTGRAGFGPRASRRRWRWCGLIRPWPSPWPQACRRASIFLSGAEPASSAVFHRSSVPTPGP